MGKSTRLVLNLHSLKHCRHYSFGNDHSLVLHDLSCRRFVQILEHLRFSVNGSQLHGGEKVQVQGPKINVKTDQKRHATQMAFGRGQVQCILSQVVVTFFRITAKNTCSTKCLLHMNGFGKTHRIKIIWIMIKYKMHFNPYKQIVNFFPQ